ncbi:hypothetical protein ACWIUA_12050 [Ursidibacter sp. B-7004-1]
MTTANQKLAAFAQAVGTDYKELKGLISQVQSTLAELAQSNAISTQIQQAITALKNELMGGELDEQLDTLKELGDKLKELQNDDSVAGAVTQKLTELKQKIETVETAINALNTADFVQIYQTAKGV